MALSQEEWQFLVLALVVAAFVLGRLSAGGGSKEDREARRLAERQVAEETFSKMSPQVQENVGRLLAQKKIIDAVKLVRQETGLDLRGAKQVVDARRAAMGLG